MKKFLSISVSYSKKLNLLLSLLRKNYVKVLMLAFIFLSLEEGKVNAAVTYTWTGGTSNAWALSGNWSSSGGTYPGTAAGDIVVIPNNTTNNNPTMTVTPANSIASITFTYVSGAGSATLTITGVTLTVTGAVTLNTSASSNTACTITGTGTLSCATVAVGSTVTPTSATAYTETMTCNIALLQTSSTLTLTDNFANPNRYLNSAFTQGGSGTVTLGGTLTTAGTTLNASNTFTYTMGASTTLNLGAATSVTTAATAASTFNFNGSGATVYYTLGSAQTLFTSTTTTYMNLQTSGGAGTKTVAAAAMVIQGDLTIGAGTTWSKASGTVSIAGNFYPNGAFTSGTGAYTLSGTSKAITGTVNSTNLLTFAGALTVTGTYVDNVTTTTVTGNLTGAGSLQLTANSILNLGGTSTLTTLDATTNSPTTVNYNGASAQTIKSGQAFVNLNVNNAAGATLGGPITATTLTIGNNTTNSIFSDGGYAISTATTLTITSGTYNCAAPGATAFPWGTATVSAGNVNYNGTVAQTVAGETYGTLQINNSAGATLGATTTVTNLTIGNNTSNSIFNDGGYQITGTGTLTLTSGNFTLGSGSAATSWPGFVTNTISSGTTVTYASGIAQTVSTTLSYQNLTITGAGIKTIAAGTLNIAGDLSGNGSLTQGSGLIALSGNWLNTGTFTASSAGVTMSGTGKQITGADGLTFTTLTINGTITNNNPSTSSGLTVSTALNGTSTLTQALNTILNIGGTVGITTLNCTAFTPNTVNYNGGVQTIFATTYDILTLSGSGNKTFGSSITINENLNLNGTAVALLTDGTTSGANNLWFSGVLQTNGSWGSTASSATNQNDTWFNNTANGIINITLNCVAGVWTGEADGNWNNTGNWCAGVLPTSTIDVDIPSAAPNQPSISLANANCRGITIENGASLSMSGGTNILTVSGNWNNKGGTFSGGTNTVIFNGSTQSIGGSASTTFNNLSTSGSTNTSLGIATVISGNLNVGDGTTFTAGVYNLTINGTTTIGSGTSGILLISSSTGTTAFNSDITINTGATLNNSANVNISIGGNLTNNGTFTMGTAVYTLTGNGKTINGTLSIPNLTVNGTYTNNVTALTVSTALAGSGTLALGANTTLNIGGTISGISLNCITNTPNTVVYTVLTGGQPILGGTYYNLTQNNTSGINTASNNMNVNNTLTTTAGGTLNLGVYTLGGTLATITNNGTIQTQNLSSSPIPSGLNWGGTFNYNAATGGQNVVLGTYKNLTIGSSSGTNTLTGSGTLKVTGTLTIVAGSTLDMGTNPLTSVSGNFSLANSGTLKTASVPTPISNAVGTFGTVNYYAPAGGQTIFANGSAANVNYSTILINNTSGTDVFGGTFTVNNTIITSAGGTVNMLGYALSGSATTVTINGLLETQDNGNPFASVNTFLGTGTVEYNLSAGTQDVPANSTFNNLQVDCTSGLALLGACTVNGQLIFTNGNILTGNFSLTLSSTASIGGLPSSSSFVATSGTGQLIWTIPVISGSMAYMYPIGIASSTYLPVTITFKSNTAGGTLGLGLLNTTAANMNTPTAPCEYIKNMYWNFLTNTLGNYNYSATFTYPSTDLTNGTSTGFESSLRLSSYVGSAWQQYNGSSSTGYVLTSGALNNSTAALSGVFTGRNGGAAITESISGTSPQCSPATLSASATGGTSYTWYWSGGNSPLSSINTFNASGTYTITATESSTGCSSTASKSLTVNAPSVTASATTPICTNGILSLTGSATGSSPFTYSWSGPNSYTNSSQSPNIANPTTAAAGVYTLTVTDNTGCTGTASTTSVIINSRANVSLQPSPVTIVTGRNTSFSISSNPSDNTGLNYQWQVSTNSGSSYSNVTNAGIYSGTMTTTLNLTGVTTSYTGYYYRCAVTSSSPCTATINSSGALLTVNVSPTSGLWDGGTSTDWNDGTNWDDGNVPVSSTNVVIPSSAPYQPVLSVSGTCNNITINPKASISVTGTLACEGNLLIESDATGTGAFTQSDAASVSITGNVTVQRYLSSLGYHYLASPLQGVTCDGLNGFSGMSYTGGGTWYDPNYPTSISPYPNMWRIDESHTHSLCPSDYNSWYAPAKTETMSAGVGYAINIATGAKTVSVSNPGTDLTAGSITASVSKEAASTDTGHNNEFLDQYGILNGAGAQNVGTGPTNGWHLIGNPYASPVDWNALVTGGGHGANIVYGISIFKPTTQWTGVYGTYYYNGFITSNSGAFNPGRYIPSMQSFFIQNTYTGAGNSNSALTFNNAYRTVISAALNANFYRGSESEVESSEYPNISLYGYKTVGSSELGAVSSMKDKAVIMFGAQNSDFGAGKLMNTDENVPNIYSINMSQEMSIQGISELNNDLIVPLGFDVNTSGNYTINAGEILNFPTGTHIYLEDLKNKVSQDLTLNPNYSFAISKGDADNRFFLKFAQSLQTNAGSAEMFEAYSNDNIIVLNYNNPANAQATLSIFNILGQNMEEMIIENGEWRINPNVAPGDYIVRLVTNDKVYVKKVYLQ